MIAPEFLPKRLLAGHYLFWMMAAVLLQAALAGAGFYALKTFNPLGPWHITAAESESLRPWLWRVGLAQGIAMLVVCVVLPPLLRRSLRSRRRQVRELLEAIRHFARGFAQGFSPKPVSVNNSGELGYLAAAFNDMAGRLESSRQALVKANANLEQEVERRTHELRNAVSQLHQMALQDPLTGLANRRALTEAGDNHFQRREQDIACLMIDLDGFKGVNDTLGHQAGDELLHKAAETICHDCREADVVARPGGDEFVALMPGCTDETALAAAKRIIDRFEQAAAAWLGDDAARLERLPSMSIGVASRRTNQAASADQLLVLADQALYDGKGAGKGCVIVYQPKGEVSPPHPADEATVAGQPVASGSD